jgi:lipopolysaccharide heptosyltransferase II
MKRFLIVKLWALGDILMATPVLRALKQHFPDCHITWFVEKAHMDALADNPLIDELIAFDTRTWRQSLDHGNLIAYFRTSLRLYRDLKRHRFDAVLNLTPEKWWSIWFNVAPIRVGLFPSMRRKWMRRFYTQAIFRSHDSRLHNTTHYLQAVRGLGIPGPFDERMVLSIREEDRNAVRAFLEAEADYDPQKPLLVLHPGTSMPSKCWPTDLYAAVVEALNNRVTVVITGSPKEAPLADAILAVLPPDMPRPLVATGKLDRLSQTAALIESSSAVVTGDTSALHIASALGTPLVGLYGSTRPGRNAPLFGTNVLLYDDHVSCAPCRKSQCPLKGPDHMRCQKAVTPSQVLSALQILLADCQKDPLPWSLGDTAVIQGPP